MSWFQFVCLWTRSDCDLWIETSSILFFYGIACFSTLYKNLEILLMFDLLLNRAQGRKKHSLHGLQLLVWQTTVGRLLQCPLLEFFNKRPTIVDRLVRNVLIPFNLFFSHFNSSQENSRKTWKLQLCFNSLKNTFKCMSYLKSEIIAIETKRKQSIKQFFLANQQLQFVISIFFCRICRHIGSCWLANRTKPFGGHCWHRVGGTYWSKIIMIFSLFQNKLLLLFQIRLDSRHRYLFPGLYF